MSRDLDTEGRAPESGSEGAAPCASEMRCELAEELDPKYRRASRPVKGRLLGSFRLATRYGRKYAIKVL